VKYVEVVLLTLMNEPVTLPNTSAENSDGSDAVTPVINAPLPMKYVAWTLEAAYKFPLTMTLPLISFVYNVVRRNVGGRVGIVL
jgi:hypothetical protein